MYTLVHEWAQYNTQRQTKSGTGERMLLCEEHRENKFKESEATAPYLARRAATDYVYLLRHDTSGLMCEVSDWAVPSQHVLISLARIGGALIEPGVFECS
jgi:hypothetical protein